MKFFRNPEWKASLLWHFLLLALALAAGRFYAPDSLRLLAAFSALFISSHYWITWRRYCKLRQLSDDIDSMLHSQTPIRFEKYREGELSILESELSKMTLRLSEQAQALENDKQLLADSMADISHQIRSPLTSSNLILSLLKDSKLPPERRQELLLELSQLLSRIDWLVEALLKMSKMDAGTACLQHAPVSVEELIRCAHEPLEIPMELRCQTFTVHKGTEHAQFIGDLSWSTEALLNILKNCMEHTPPGGCVQVSYFANAIYTEIIVEDNGSGFDKEDLPHLFKRFYKGKNASSQSVGIGLALARMIISQQNGTLKAENRKEGGAKFTVKFYH